MRISGSWSVEVYRKTSHFGINICLIHEQRAQRMVTIFTSDFPPPSFSSLKSIVLNHLSFQTLFNPNKTVVKMFVVIYDLREMPANHQTFLRQRTFSVPVRREIKRTVNKENSQQTEERLLRYLIHLRFQSSKSGKIYLHRDVRLLFSRKSMEVDSGAAYELKSYTESPTNPQFSPRC